jgi:hypothetical protein
MRPLANIALIALALSGCTAVKKVPLDVAIPVALPCPIPAMRTVERPAELALANITSVTPMDVDVRQWQATTLQLFAYIAGLEASVKDRDAVLAACAGAP